MDLLINPQTSYLLQADLASLHVESQSWLSEIEFWEDELAFFYTLLHSKLSRQAYPTEEIASLDKRLVSINSDMLGTIKEQALNHERFLALVMQTTSMQEESNYRDVHQQLRVKMIDVHAAIKNFKKEVYASIRKYESK
jgi:phosphoribosyl-dephospho-CoA transferase